MQGSLINSAAIGAQIPRFESVNRNTYLISELLDLEEKMVLQNQIQEYIHGCDRRSLSDGLVFMVLQRS